MLRSWLKTLRACLFTSPRPTNRRSHLARLEVENLETREVLSATVPGFTLSNGNLYHNVGSQQQLIDTGVQDFAVVNNRVFDLHTDHTLQALNTDGSGKVSLSNDVQSFAVGNDGNAYYLKGSHLWNATTGTDVHAGVLAMAPRGDGRLWVNLGAEGLQLYNAASSVYINYGVVQSLSVGPDSNIYYVQNGTGHVNGQAVWSHTRDLAVSANGTLFWLSDYGLLQMRVPGGTWQNLATGVAKIAVSPDGICYSVVPATNTGYINGRAVWAHTRDVTVTPDGTLFWLSDYGLLQKLVPGAGSWQNLATDVTALALGNNGDAYYQKGGHLWNATTGADVHGNVRVLAQGPDGRIWLDLGIDGLRLYNPVTSSYPGWGAVQGFTIGNDGNAYFLQSGHLWKAQSEATRDVDIHSGVLALASSGDGQIWLNLGQDGLRLYNPGTATLQTVTTGSTTNRYTPTVVSLAVDGAGALIALGSDGYLSRFALGSTQGQWIDSAVTNYVVDGTGAVWSLSQGLLARFTPGTGSRMYVTTGPSATTQSAASFVSFAVDGAGSVVALGKDGYLSPIPFNRFCGTRGCLEYR